MRARIPTLTVLYAGLALAQSELLPPGIGLLRDVSGGLRRVLGTRANFVLGGVLAEGVESAAHWRSSGLIKTAMTVDIVDETGAVSHSSSAPPGPALFGFTQAGAPAVVYFPDSGELRWWHSGDWRPAELDTHGEIVAVSGGPGGSILAVERRGKSSG